MTKQIPPSENEFKYIHSARIKQHVRQIFLSGRRVTAVQINHEANTNDGRKIISELRKEGMRINDVRMADRSKLYWLEKDVNQKSLNFNDADNG